MTKKHDKDYDEFCSYDRSEVPDFLNTAVLKGVEKDLNPSWGRVVGKLVFLQGFVGLLTLLFCPQFELSLTAHTELYHYFHRHFGLYGCMAICGAIFMGSGAVAAAFILRFSELNLILRSKYLLSFALSGIAVVMFLIFGAETYLSLALSWIAGGSIATILAFDGGKVARSLLLRLNRA